MCLNFVCLARNNRNGEASVAFNVCTAIATSILLCVTRKSFAFTNSVFFILFHSGINGWSKDFYGYVLGNVLCVCILLYKVNFTPSSRLPQQIHYVNEGHVKTYFSAETRPSVLVSRLLFFIFLGTTRDQSLKGIRSLLGLDID